jgi:hypothetical protein
MNQDAWKAPSVENRGRWWMTFRLAPFALLVTLAALFACLLFQPFFHPRVCLFFATAEYPGSLLPPHASHAENLAAIQSHEVSRLSGPSAKEVVASGSIASPAALDQLLDQLDHHDIRERDVLIGWIGGQIVTHHDDIELLCGNFDPMDVQTGRYPIANLLSRIRGCPAQTKLILLDSGWFLHAPRLGMVVDCSASQLRAMVENSKDPSLWVLVASADFERSHTIVQPNQSVFAHFLGEGLQGAADRNGDRIVDVGELARFTRERLADWVRSETANQGSQTVTLLWGGGQIPPGMKYPAIMPAVPVKHSDDSQQIAGDAGSAAAGLHLSRPPERMAAPALPASAKPAEKSDASDKSVPSAPAVKTVSDLVQSASPAELQGMAWSLHDQLAGSPNLRVIDDSPHFWRALQDRLLALQAAARSADASRSSAAASDLRRLVRQLTDLADGRMPQQYQVRDFVSTMAHGPENLKVEATMPSLALTEKLAQPPPADLAGIAQRLDAATEKSDNADLKKLIADLSPKWNDYIEIRLARQLLNQPNLDWPSIQLAVRARHMAENVAAAMLDSGSWTREEIRRGDQLLLAGERKMLAPLRPGEIPEAAQLIQRSIDEYEDAAAWNRDVLALNRLVNDTLFWLPDCLQWSIVAIPDSDAVSPDAAVLKQLIESATRSALLLDQPSAAKLPDVRRFRHELETLLNALRARISVASRALPAGEPTPVQVNGALPAPQFEPLPTANLRMSLGRLPDWSVAMERGSEAVKLPPTRDPSGRFRRAAEVYAAATSLLLRDLPQTDREVKSLASAKQAIHSAIQKADADELPRIIGHFGDTLAGVLQGLPEVIQRQCAESEDMTDPASRARLLAARRLLFYVHPWDVDRMTFTGPSQLLRRAQLYEFLSWQQQRCVAAAAGAQADERAHLLEAADRCRRIAATIPMHPPVAKIRPPEIEIELPAQVDLTNESEREFPVSITNRHDSGASVWLLADYDAETIAVTARDQANFYDETSVRRSSMPNTASARRSAEDMPHPPYETLGNLDPTCVLQPGETKTVWLQLDRKTLAGGDARVAFRAVSRSECVRRDLTVAMTHRLSVDLGAEGIDGSWRSQDSGLTLFPFPNRATTFTLFFVNSATSERSIDFEILRTDVPVGTLPLSDVSRELSDKYLARLDAASSLVKLEKITVEGGGRRVPIPLIAPAGPKPKIQTLAEDKMPSLAGNLLAVITDRATGRRVIKRLEIYTQRPARYVRPSAEYDAVRRRLDIVIQPVKRGAVPPGGIWIDGQPVAGDLIEGQHRSGTWLRSPATEAVIHVGIPVNAGPVFPVFLNVDGFDRAFGYEVPANATSRSPVRESIRVAARILEPRAGTCYGPKTAEVPVSLQVDAPHGLLLDGTNFVEVGIDTNRDRELRHKEVLRLTSDRQVDLSLEAIGSNGTFVVRSKVSDLHVSLPPPRVKAMRANIIARVSIAAGDAWSEPVEVIFDDEPPRLSRLQVVPGEKVIQGSNLDISVLASDNELSGVSKVEAALDFQRKGEFADPPPMPATMQADGRWSLKIPTKSVPPGVYGLLIRATDRLGNPSDYLKASVEIVAADPEAAKRAARGQIGGRVAYGRFEKQPVSGVSVHLLAKGDQVVRDAVTDNEGRFNMADVPPGDYKLCAEKLISGNRRTAQKDVKVSSPPSPAEPVELILVSSR